MRWSGPRRRAGFALALGKPVIGYLDSNETTVARVARVTGQALEIRAGRPVDRDGLHVEDFGLPLNLMLAVPATVVVGTLRDAIRQLDCACLGDHVRPA